MLIELKDITRVYHTGDVEVRALAGVSLAIDRGEFVAIIGSSGSGKSTLMSILGCLDRPTSGQYLLNGIDVARLTEPELARIRSERLGFVFQSFNLLPRTSAIENVALPLLLFCRPRPLGGSPALRAPARRSSDSGLADREHNTPGAAVRRTAAAGRDCAGADQLAEPAARRRADRQPRHAHLARDHGDADRAQSRAGRHRSSS